jgi:hypothetical protein
MRAHTLENVVLEGVAALVRKTPQPEHQELQLVLKSGTAGQYRRALTEFKLELESWRDRFQKLSAGAEEAGPPVERAVWADSPADRAAWADLEGILRNPDAPQRVPVEIQEVSFGGARVLYRGAAGGITEGFLPMGQVFSDPNRVMRVRAKVTWLAGRVRSSPADIAPALADAAWFSIQPR